jgi:hypothetical protein
MLGVSDVRRYSRCKMKAHAAFARAIQQSLLCAAVVAALAYSHDTRAQFGGGMRGGGMGGGMRESKGGRERPPEAAPVLRRYLPDEIDERLYLFEEELRLTREQRPLWDRYADAVRAGAKDAERDRVRSEAREKLAVLQRIDRLVEASRNRLTALEDIALSSKTLYSSLSPAQRDICDPRLASIASLLWDSATQLAAAPPPARK